MADGSTMMVISMVNHSLDNEWGLDVLEKGMLGSSIFFGILVRIDAGARRGPPADRARALRRRPAVARPRLQVGSLTMGNLGDRWGRKFPVAVSLAIMVVAGAGSAFAPTYGVLLLARGLVGIGVGGTLPLASAYTAEFAPSRHRAKAITILNQFFVLGEVFAAACAWCV